LLNLLRSLRVVRGKELYKSLLLPIDERLPANQLVLGAEINGVTKAYPLSVLDKTKSVINDTLGNSEIVVFHKPETWTAIAFSRQLGNEVLVFDRTENGKIIDRNTGSYWNYAGEAYDGELAGQKLSFIFSGVEKWYSWAAYHPQTNIFNE